MKKHKLMIELKKVVKTADDLKKGPPKRVFIIGAGVSTDIGVATLYKMAEQIQQEYRLSTLTDGFYHKNMDEQKKYYLRKATSDNYLKIIKKFNKCKNNIDRLWYKLNVKEKYILKNLYFWYFWDKRNHSSSINNRFESSRALRLFYKFLNPVGDSIISFNYDTMLEEAITFENAEDFSYDYGFCSDTNKIQIIKPLGSVNWLVKEKCSNCNPALRTLISKGRYSLFETRLYFEKPQDLAYIPTIYGKVKLNSKIQQLDNILWKLALDKIEKSDELWVIGYNLSKKGNLNPNLKKFLKNVKKHKKLFIVNNNKDQKKFIQKGQEGNFVYSNFSDWICSRHELEILFDKKKMDALRRCLYNFPEQISFSCSATNNTSNNRTLNKIFELGDPVNVIVAGRKKSI